MTEQAQDFREECDALYKLLEPLGDEDFERTTQFKGWTINNVMTHLNIWNWAADKTLQEPEAFQKFLEQIIVVFTEGKPITEFEASWSEGIKGRELLAVWRETYNRMADAYAAADPKQRVKWAGPDMSARSKVTARLMETWAHGQEVFDLLGVVREEKDRIKNIAQLGVNTFGWTFINRQREAPGPVPYVRLTAPSGAIWEWNEASEESKVEGPAVDFCQVVAQTRNIGDTSLVMVGDVAREWMSIAQCFAGPPNDPPAPGTRYTVT